MVKQVLVNSSSLSSIGDAIRNKKGLPAESKFTPSEMSEQINSMPVVPEEGLTLTGNCDNMFSYGKFSFMMNVPGVKTKDIETADCMFENCYNLTEIPFDLNFKGEAVNIRGMFSSCMHLKKLPKLNNLNVGNTVSLFCSYCSNLEDASSLASVNLETLHDIKTVQYSSMFFQTYKLKEIPSSFLSNLYNTNTGWGYTIYNTNSFDNSGVSALKGLPVLPYEYTKNFFGSGTKCVRHTFNLKSLTFDTNGIAPKVAK